MKKIALRPFGAALSGMLILILLSVIGQWLQRRFSLSDGWMLGVRVLTYVTPCLFMRRAGIRPEIPLSADGASPIPPAGFALVCGIGVRYLFLLLQYTHRIPMTDTGSYPSWENLVSALLLAPILEEIFFRGYLLRGLLTLGPRLATVISAVFFALQHDSLSGIFNALLCGMMLAECALRPKGLLICIGAHFLLNGSNLLHSVLPQTVAVGIDLLLFVAGAGVSLTTLFRKKSPEAGQ